MARKKSKKSTSTSASAPTTDAAASNSTIKVDGEEISVETSLNRARDALDASQQQMLVLHRAWRSQLQRVGAMVLIIVLKQAMVPASDCLQDINDWNEKITTDASSNNNNISGGGGGGSGFFNRKKNNNNNAIVLDESLFIGNWEAGKYCITDSMMEILCTLCCMSLIWLMFQPVQGDDFTSLPFRLAVSFVPLIISSYYNNPVVGCLKDLIDDADAVEKPRSFPVVLFLLVGGFTSLYFMKYQQGQQDENIQKIEKLREDLLGSKKKK